jgi:hypothetical protein
MRPLEVLVEGSNRGGMNPEKAEPGLLLVRRKVAPGDPRRSTVHGAKVDCASNYSGG